MVHNIYICIINELNEQHTKNIYIFKGKLLLPRAQVRRNNKKENMKI